MATLIYSPQIRAHIATSRDVFDVSDDIANASVIRRKGVSSFSLSLTNRGGKYNSKFSPMDRVTIYLKRIGPPLLVMSGYLDAAPVYATHTSTVQLRGSCTLKRLQHWAWDPASQAANQLITMQRGDSSATDGGIAQMIPNILTKVVGWPKEKIHIGAVPTEWFETLGELGEAEIARGELAEMVSMAGNPALAGENLIQGTSTIAGVGKGTGTLPSQIAIATTFGGSNGEPGYMSLTREPIRLADSARAQWGGAYYVQAEWPFRDEDGRIVDGVDANKATAWWRNRPILLTNPRTGKGVVARAAHWGPGGGGDHVRVSKPAYDALGLKSGQALHMAFPPTHLLGSFGPLDMTSQSRTGSPTLPVPGGNAIMAAVNSALAVTRNGEAMPTHPSGVGVVNTFAALEEFLRWCVARGITVTEHPLYGGVTPGAHASIAQGGFHWWPAPNGGGAADIWVAGGGQRQERLLDEAALEASRRNLGVIWKAPNHWGHMHVAVQNTRNIGRLVYASDAALRALPPLRIINGSPGSVGSVGAVPGATGTDPAAMGEALYQTFMGMDNWREGLGELIGGKRALINDVMVYSTIDELFKVGLREWCSAPNGDIIGWFPDYFARHGTAAKMIVEPVEVAGDGIKIDWSDDRLKTHMFVTSSQHGGGFLLDQPGEGSNRSFPAMVTTAGIASVEYPQMMRALFGMDGPLYDDGAKRFLERFGARPDWEPMDIISGPRAEFFFSVYRFMKNWSDQYSARVQLTFMPELYPGMVVAFPHWGIQAYCDQVTHTINMQTGFMTTVTLTAWSKIGGHPAVIEGLPIGGAL